jgi:hypothetical protein
MKIMNWRPRTAFRVAVVVGLGLASLIVGPSGASASTAPRPVIRDGITASAPNNIIVAVDTQPDNGGVIGILQRDLPVGDCISIQGWNVVKITYPDASGQAQVSWYDWALTTHTNNADIWHQSVELLDGSYKHIAGSPQMDGDPMRIIGQRYFWRRTTTIHLDRSSFGRIQHMYWYVSC